MRIYVANPRPLDRFCVLLSFVFYEFLFNNVTFRQMRCLRCTFPIKGKDSWRKCKLLGSLLDTKEDIQRRKMITISTMKENSHVYNSKYLTLSQKIRHFRVFAECIFLYNCELWSTTKLINDSIDSIHRRQLRYALGITYPRVITNQQLYDVRKCEPWSIVTERRRLSGLDI